MTSFFLAIISGVCTTTYMVTTRYLLWHIVIGWVDVLKNYLHKWSAIRAWLSNNICCVLRHVITQPCTHLNDSLYKPPLKLGLYEQLHFIAYVLILWSMMTSSNGNIFRVTVPLCGEFTGPGEFPTQRPVTRSFDVFFDLRLNKRLSKQREAGNLRRHRGHYDVSVMTIHKRGSMWDMLLSNDIVVLRRPGLRLWYG